MKKFLLVIMALSFLLCACSSDDNDTPQKEEEKEEDVRYYVKYEVTAKTQHINPIKTIKFTTEEGSKTIELTDLSLPNGKQPTVPFLKILSHS